MNLPNSITMSRIVMIPLLLWILTPHFPWHAHGAQEITASVLFVLASITDGLDGYLARRRSQVTTMGMLLDPIADKIMVAGALIALVAYNPEVVKVWIVVVIIGRELAVLTVLCVLMIFFFPVMQGPKKIIRTQRTVRTAS